MRWKNQQQISLESVWEQGDHWWTEEGWVQHPEHAPHSSSSPGTVKFPVAGMCQQERWQQTGRSRGCLRGIMKGSFRKGQVWCPSSVCLLFRKSCFWSFKTLPLGITNWHMDAQQRSLDCHMSDSWWQLGPGTGSLIKRPSERCRHRPWQEKASRSVKL